MINYLHPAFIIFKGELTLMYQLCPSDSTKISTAFFVIWVWFLFSQWVIIFPISQTLCIIICNETSKHLTKMEARKGKGKIKSLLVLHLENSYKEDWWTQTDCCQNYKAWSIAKPRVLIISLMIQQLL